MRSWIELNLHNDNEQVLIQFPNRILEILKIVNIIFYLLLSKNTIYSITKGVYMNAFYSSLTYMSILQFMFTIT